ncbi:MAG: HpsJ family protein [Spirulinaceae cyanobacterium]
MNNPVNSSYTSLTLKIVGVILIISSLLDYLVLGIPFKPLDPIWQINYVTQMVDRGIIPMVGIAFLVVGYWIGNLNTDVASGTRPASSFKDLRFWSFIIASILGLIFLLIVPLHLNNINKEKSNALEQIEERAGQFESRIAQESEQLGALLQNDQALAQINEAIESGKVNGQELNDQQIQELEQRRASLEELKDNPEAIEERISEAENQLGTRKKEAEKNARAEAFKLGVRTGISSLLLAIGYMVIGWTGLRSVTSGASGGRRKAPKGAKKPK